MNISLIIPAYNESEGVKQTAEAVRNLLKYLRKSNEVEVLFVNDGSKDNTASLLEAEFADDPNVRVLSHEVNQGLGAAMRTGFASAKGDFIITTDFDGTYPLNTIPQLLGRMTVTNADVVTASPYHPQGHVEGVPGYRLFISQCASLMYRLLVKWDIHTWTSLYRVYRRSVIENVSFEEDGFLSLTQILVGAVKDGYVVVEFPTTLYVRTFGQSSIKIARVTKSHLKYQARLLLKSITGADSRRSAFMKAKG